MPHANLVLRAALCGLLFLSAPAFAQYGASTPPPTPPEPRGNRSSDQPAAPPTPAPFAEVLRAAACSVGRDARPAVALLSTTPFSDQERTQGASFMRNAQRCLRQNAAIPTSAYILRGAVAETLYEAQFATPPAARAPALAARPLPRPGSGLNAAAQQQLAPMYLLADCAGPGQPALVRAVLATEPGTPGETAALTALHPAFAACVPAGTQLTYDPRIIRMLLVEALYRWAVVQRDGATSPFAAPSAAPAPSGQ